MYNQNNVVPVKVFSLNFIKYFWITMRPYLLFVSGITGIVGLSFAPTLSTFSTTILVITFFFSYGFGQALTDCFQIDTDSLSSPYRPLTQGKISKQDVLKVSLTGLSLIGIILTFYALFNLLLTTLAIMGLATYTYFKKRWWAGPFYNAWIVSVLCLIGYVAGSGNVKLILDTKLYFTLLTVFIGYANFVLSGYFKDISADRKTGYNTLPVVYGVKISSVVSDIFAFVTVIFTGVVFYLIFVSDPNPIFYSYSFVFFIAGCCATLFAQIRLHKVKDESEAHGAISLVVHAYILLLASITVAQKPVWALFLILFYIGFIVTMKFRPMKAQI